MSGFFLSFSMNWKEQFLLDPTIHYLNFGSFGACTKEIFAHYQELQLMLEREPVQFITKTGMDLLAKSREALADYIDCHADDVVYTTNPSYAMNTVIRSIELKAGDEVLSTNLEYGAMDRTWDYYCDKSGAKYLRSEIDLPIQSKEGFIAQVLKDFSPRTKVLFISQITSATGLVLPVKELVDEANKRGILTIVDGAHVPGHIELSIRALNADIYTGACHKWMMAPKGASFLHVKPEHQHWIDPLVISWGYQSAFPSHSQFLDYHQTNGTRDFTAFLTIPTCINYMAKHNWREMARKMQSEVIQFAKEIQEEFQFQPLAPIDPEWIAQLYSIPIHTQDPQALQRELFESFRIEIPVTQHGERHFIRYSFQAFTSEEDKEALRDALRELNQKYGLFN